MPVNGNSELDETGRPILTAKDAGDNAVPVAADSDGNLSAVLANASPGIDPTNDVHKVADKGAGGSGGVITASGTIHNAPCCLTSIALAASSAAVFRIYDGTSTGGTLKRTYRVLAGDSKEFNPKGMAMATAVYVEFVSGAGEAAVTVTGPVQ